MARRNSGTGPGSAATPARSAVTPARSAGSASGGSGGGSGATPTGWRPAGPGRGSGVGGVGDVVDFKFKVLMLGDSAVGKSCIMDRLVHGDAVDMNKTSTMGFDLGTKTLVASGKIVKMTIWDTAGQERFRSIASNYYRGAQGVVMCFDLTSTASFRSIKTWMRAISEHASGCSMVLVGNKADLAEGREVSTKAGQEVAKELGVPYLETSARTGINVEAAYVALAERMVAAAQRELGGGPAAPSGGAGGSGGAASGVAGGVGKATPSAGRSSLPGRPDSVVLTGPPPAAVDSGGGTCGK